MPDTSDNPDTSDTGAGTQNTPTTPPPNQNPPTNTPPSTRQDAIGGREMLAAIQALPEKLANVLQERTPPPQPANPPVSQGVSNGSQTGGSQEPAGNSSVSPGAANGGNAGSNSNSAPAGSSKKSFTDWWFGG